MAIHGPQQCRDQCLSHVRMSHVLPKRKKKMVSGNSWAAAVSRSWFVSHRNESRLTGENKKVVSGDSWASAVSRSMFGTDEYGAEQVDTGVAFFFIVYLFVASTVLMNVVIAVLLDE